MVRAVSTMLALSLELLLLLLLMAVSMWILPAMLMRPARLRLLLLSLVSKVGRR